MDQNVLVTGASGFIGTELVAQLTAGGYKVRAASRDPRTMKQLGLESVQLPDAGEPVRAFTKILDGMNHVVHLAAIAHRMTNDSDAYHDVNYVLTAKLAEAAHQTIDGKYIFLSSIRAQCATMHEGVAVENDLPQPTDDYGREKLAAEREIIRLMKNGNFTILRPVLVYGTGTKGNMAALMRFATLPIPLPLELLSARRSLLDRSSLCRAILHCLKETQANGRIFIVADRTPITVPQIITAIRAAMGRNPGLFSFPLQLLELAARSTGWSERWRTLSMPLIASSSQLQSTGWRAIEDTAEQIKSVFYLKSR